MAKNEVARCSATLFKLRSRNHGFSAYSVGSVGGCEFAGVECHAGSCGSVAVLHTFLLIIAGLVFVGVLSAILEKLGMRDHAYAARIVAAVPVIGAAYTHTWLRLLIGIGFAWAYLLVRREWQIRTSGK
jgi:hypothetical protein